MADWRQVATAMAPDIPEQQVERIAAILDTLQEQLTQLASRIPSGSESAISFAVVDEDA